MKNYVIETKSELKGSSSTGPKAKKTLGKIGDILLVCFFVFALVVSSTIFFLKARFVACFVSGMSMYPTFNSSGVTIEGKKLNPYNGYESTEVGSEVDYLLADERDDFKDDITRFNVVCSYFPGDFTGTKLKDNVYEKIKRVIGLPGETVWLVTSNEDGNKYSGNLYVSKDPTLTDQLTTLNPETLIQLGYQITKIDQKLPDSFYDETIKYSLDNPNEKYNGGISIAYSYCWRLAEQTDDQEGEYVLLGDNRIPGYSRDSRSVGKIPASYIKAKVKYKIGLGVIEGDGNTANYDFCSLTWRKI